MEWDDDYYGGSEEAETEYWVLVYALDYSRNTPRHLMKRVWVKRFKLLMDRLWLWARNLLKKNNTDNWVKLEKTNSIGYDNDHTN